MTHTPSLPGPVFKFSRETNAVRVENIPHNVNRLDVLSLFSTLIGDIRVSQDSDEALEITFFTADSARKALCMSGYNVAGSALLVSSIVRAASPAQSHGHYQGRRADLRRNLYVLGVPFGITNQSLAALFASHGTVSHCVILATLDGASRRRGFVVMSTHEEARHAMAALGRSGKSGGGMDISWAVVQRSKGFLDGGDRAGVVYPTASALGCPPPPLGGQLLPDGYLTLPSLSPVPTTTLLLANLPSMLFGSEDDLRGLVCPFGSVKALRIADTSTPSASASSSMPTSSCLSSSPSTEPAPPTLAAIVQYAALSAAQDAQRALDGESYVGCTVRVVFLAEPDSEPVSAPESPLPLTPTFPPPLTFQPSLSAPFALAPRCGLPAHKPAFDGRDVGNQGGAVNAHAGRQWQGSGHVQQQQFYAPPPFPSFESLPGYGVSGLHGRWTTGPLYVRGPSTRDMGYYA